jgi:hypothetical protein
MTGKTSTSAARRGITPGKLPLREQAALFERLLTGRQRRPLKSWRQLATEEGFAQRTLEDFYRSAKKLEENADKRSLAQIFLERLRAPSTATPAARRSRRGLAGVGGDGGRSVDDLQTKKRPGKEPMTHTQAEQHPARINHLMEALRETEDGEWVADRLDLLFMNAPSFRLPGTPDNEWDYVRCVLKVFTVKPGLCSLVFGDPYHAFMAAYELGEVVAEHGGT